MTRGGPAIVISRKNKTDARSPMKQLDSFVKALESTTTVQANVSDGATVTAAQTRFFMRRFADSTI